MESIDGGLYPVVWWTDLRNKWKVTAIRAYKQLSSRRDRNPPQFLTIAYKHASTTHLARLVTWEQERNVLAKQNSSRVRKKTTTLCVRARVRMCVHMCVHWEEGRGGEGNDRRDQLPDKLSGTSLLCLSRYLDLCMVEASWACNCKGSNYGIL